MKTRTYCAVALLSSAGFAIGCNNDEPKDATGFIELRPATLTAAQSCEDLESNLKADALARMHAQMDMMLEWAKEYDNSGWGFDSAGTDGDVAASGGQEAANDSGSNGGATSGPPNYSETNVQVEGVDEADIVKTDGSKLYVVRDNAFSIVDAFPAENLALNKNVEIEGHPIEMYLADDKAVVFSMVDGEAVYKASGVEARSPYDGYGWYAEDGYTYYPTLTKVTVLNIDGVEPEIEQEQYFEAYYSSSRRIDRDVRIVFNGGHHGPAIQYWPNGDSYPDSSMEWVSAIESLRLLNEAVIAQSTLADYIPNRFLKTESGIEVQAPSCTSFYTPTQGTTDYGMTTIASFNLDELDAGTAETTIVGATQTIYSSQDAMYLAAQSYNAFSWGLISPAIPTQLTATHIHKFDIKGNAAPKYVASGTVPGSVHDQFSLDERDGVLRLTTTETVVSRNEWRTSNDVYTLEQSGRHLDRTGEIRGLAPDEMIFSTRFVGDRGYVVTFRQVDPLFVIDLSNPSAPKVMAELKIPGFSEYMHPIDDGKKLLTIGQDGDDDGFIEGVALQIFDVSDPRNPVLTHKHVIDSDSWGYSEALYNHKAFTYYQDMLAIPFEAYDYEDGSLRSSLELFRISAEDGISPIASIDHSQFYTSDYASYCYGVGVRRGVFIEDNLYSISHGGVIVNNLNDMSEPVASLAFEQSQECEYYYY